MSDRQIVVGQRAERTESRVVESLAVWKMVAPVGLVFLLIGLVDIGLVWYPISFGNPDWEFGTIGTTLNNLPLPTLGIMLLAAWAVVTDRKALARVAGGVIMALGVVLAGLVLVYLLTLPPVWNAVKAVENPSARALATKGMAKSIVQAGLYPLLFIFVGLRVWRLPK